MEEDIIFDIEIPGWSSGNELTLLSSLARLAGKGATIVELGSFAGRTAWIMAQKNPDATIHCIDPWGHFDIRNVPEESLVYISGDISMFKPGDLQDLFSKNTADCPNIVAHRGLSTEVPWEGQAEVDMIFIDADHDTGPLLADMRTWWPRMKKDGIMVGHDWQMQTVREAVMQFLREVEDTGVFPQIIHFPGCSIWGFLLGGEHARRWGIDFTPLLSKYLDWNMAKPRSLEEVRALTAKALANQDVTA